MSVEIRKMHTGALRQWSEIRPASNWLPYDGGGYVGSYVCRRCQREVDGVYHVIAGIHVCSRCRDARYSPFAVERASRKGSGDTYPSPEPQQSLIQEPAGDASRKVKGPDVFEARLTLLEWLTAILNGE